MDPKLDSAYKRTRIFSIVGAALMILIALLCAAMFVLYLYAQSRVGSYITFRHGWFANKLTALAMPIAAAVLLACFFLHIAIGRRPFGIGQSIKLGAAGCALLLKYVLDLVRPGIDPVIVPHLEGPITIEERGMVDPAALIPIVFVIVLAFVVRYIGMLKDDSDSIL